MDQGINRRPQDPNKGLNTRKFLVSVCVAMVLIFVIFLAFVGMRQKTLMRGITHPKPTSATTPE